MRTRGEKGYEGDRQLSLTGGSSFEEMAESWLYQLFRTLVHICAMMPML